MITEAERIWRAEGGQLLWIDCTQPSAVRIVVLHGPRPIRSARYALASFDKSRAETIRLAHALGLALGRVIAHEIGHHLLGNEHAPRGLMRAVFDARTLVDPRASPNFALDESGRARLRERLRREFESPVVTSD
jgi:hypothetical protein